MLEKHKLNVFTYLVVNCEFMVDFNYNKNGKCDNLLKDDNL